MIKNMTTKISFFKNIYFALIILAGSAFLFTGCMSKEEGFEGSDELIVIEGSIDSTPTAPALNSPAGSAAAVSKNSAIAANGDMATICVNNVNEASCQINNKKFKFTGKYKGKMLSLKFGSYANEAYLGVVSASAKDTITIPALNEYNIFATEIIRKQKAQGKTAFENFILSNNQNDMIAVTNRTYGVLTQKFINESGIYGYNKEQLLQKMNSGFFDNSIFGSDKIKIFEQDSSITISPLTYSFGVNESWNFTVNLTGFINKNVTFKVNGIAGGNNDVGKITGIISGNGYAIATYTAPAVINEERQVTLSAQSVENPSAIATALITLTPVRVYVNSGITPVRIDVKTTSSYKFTADVLGHNNKEVLWYINDRPYGNPQIGYISATGIYNPPGQAYTLEKIIVKAYSAADTSKYGTCEIILN